MIRLLDNEIAVNALLELYRYSQRKSRRRLFYDEIKKRVEGLPEVQRLFSEDKVRKHYVYENVRDTLEHPDVYITQLRFYALYKYFKKAHPDIFTSETKILDAGDTSGILFEAIGKKGVSLNVNQECIDFINSKGIEAVCGNAEDIKFADRHFDYTFSFQLLEHTPNPIKVLNELARVTKSKVFVSIPYAPATNIYAIDYWVDIKKSSWKEERVKDVDCHIFEFSTEDFKKILTHTNLECEDSFYLNYFDNDSFMGKLLNRVFVSYFNFFVLRPRPKKQIF